MTFGQYWSVVQKQWKLILFCFLVTGIVTLAVSKLLTPIYQSTVLVQVILHSNNNQSDYTSLLASDQLVATEAQLAISAPVLQEVAGHYKGLPVDQLVKQVTATTKTNTQLLEIDVQDPSPSRAAALANDVAATLIKQQLDVTQQDDSKSQQQLQQDLDKTQQAIASLTSQISALQGQPGKQAQIAVLQTQLNNLQQHYTQWQTALAQLELTQAQGSDFLRVVQSAQPAVAPVRPLVLINTGAGFVAGLLLGLLLALLFEQLDTRVRTSENLVALVDWPILATLRIVKAGSKESVVNLQGQGANVEAYRILRTNIGFTSLDKPLRTLLVSSAVPAEGKSTVAANIAIFMAKAGKNTLIIDTDLRRPTLHEKFGLPIDKMGLSNAVVTLSQLQSTSQRLVHPINSLISPFSLDPFMHSVGIPNLRIMPSGPLPPNPPELLDSRAMELFFSVITHCGAEIVIFDSPPLLGLSDANILASKIDGTLLVVDITHAHRGHLKQAKSALIQSGAKVLGCVVNKDHKLRKNESYAYYYYNVDAQNGAATQHSKNGSTSATPATPAVPLSSEPQRTQFN